MDNLDGIGSNNRMKSDLSLTCSKSSSGATARKFFAKRTSFENVKPIRPQHPSDTKVFDRRASFLGRHRLHQLSDIRETSGSSKPVTLHNQNIEPSDQLTSVANTPPRKCDKCEDRSNNLVAPVDSAERQSLHGTNRGSREASTWSLPLKNIPARRSSASIFTQSVMSSRRESAQDLSATRSPSRSEIRQSVPVRVRSESPVREIQKRSAQSSEALRPSPSRTFIRTSPPLDILDHGNVHHNRVELSVQLPSPLFVGGGTIEGQISLKIDKNVSRKHELQPLFLSRISVDVIGVEETSDKRRWVFLSLASELLDKGHPPPPALLLSQTPTTDSELSWRLRPSSAVIPFCLNLPLNLGPPPYLSKHACIRYLLCPTVFIETGNKQHIVRKTWDIQVLPIHDPEKALANLPHPLLASDTLDVTRGHDPQALKLTAGLHRQIWVNGSKIFIDVHISNQTNRSIKKIEVELEKRILWYSYAAAGTLEKTASHLRLPKKSDAEIVSRKTVKRSSEWQGVPPRSSEIRTCAIEVPRGHVSIGTGRYFEVRYFVNVTVSVTRSKAVTVQVPVTIIHINSLDIFPNSLSQVAASIEAKRAKVPSTLQAGRLSHEYHPGQAFAAPRRQSVERNRNRNAEDDIKQLTHDLDNSPRQFKSCHIHRRGQRSISHLRHENGKNVDDDQDSLSHSDGQHTTCYHCHLIRVENAARPASAIQAGPKIPRLQVSTSGLGFSESEFDVSPDSPLRKVMLSEHERKILSQQRELKLQRQWSQQKKRNIETEHQAQHRTPVPHADLKAWRNINLQSGHHDRLYPRRDESRIPRDFSGVMARKRRNIRPMRSRSDTNADRTGGVAGWPKKASGPNVGDRNGRMSLNVDRTSYGLGQARMSKDRRNHDRSDWLL